MGRRGGRKRRRTTEEDPPTSKEASIEVSWWDGGSQSLPTTAALDEEAPTNVTAQDWQSLRDVWKRQTAQNPRLQSPTVIQQHSWTVLLQPSRNLVRRSGLVLVPTRELSLQVAKVLDALAIYGGVEKKEQLGKLVEANIVVATPGRLLDLLDTVSLPKLSHVILDEADRIALQPDLCEAVSSILSKCTYDAVCLCSATFPDKVRSQWDTWLRGRSTVVVRIDGQSTTASLSWSQIPPHLTQTLHVCAGHKKPRKLLQTIRKNPARGIVFFGTIKTLQYIASFLQKEKISAISLHSQMKQDDREKAVRTFQSGRVPLLLATDVAARGIHVDNVLMVINYDFPSNLEQYVHRCGRAGRNGQEGTVFSFFTRNLAPLAEDLVALLRASNQHVDPNLLDLVKGEKKEPKRAKKPTPSEASESEDDMVDWLPRVTLKRSDLVSEASESEEEIEDG